MSAQSLFLKFKGQLAQFKDWSEGPQGWEQRWSKHSLQSKIRRYANGQLGELEGVFTRYLPRDLPVLEAGCGMGNLVMALTSRGYIVEGIDFASQTVSGIKAVAPQLNVRVCEITNIDAEDGKYGGYISIGVFEHNPDGPLAALKEVRRVLHPNGTALISIPFLNRKRQRILKRALPTDQTSLSSGLRFYQYYFSPRDFKDLLRESHLSVIEEVPYGLYSGFTRDYIFGRWLHSHRFFFHRFHRWILRQCEKSPTWTKRHWAHMIMFVCRPV